MRLLLPLLIVVGVVVFVAMRASAAASTEKRQPPVDQPRPVDAEHEITPPAPGEDLSPTRPSGEPVPGSQEDRERHGKP